MNPWAAYLDPEVVRRIERLDLSARFIVEGFLSGLHRSPLHGLSVEFSEHRKYAQGDELRAIDWKVFARTDRLFVRKYQAETHMACQLVVDTSASMGRIGPVRAPSGAGAAPSGEARLTKLEYAVRLAAALAYLVVKQQDSVGLAIVDSQVRAFLPPRARRSHLLRILSKLSEVKPSGTTGLAESIGEILHRIPHRGLVIVLTDLLTSPDDALEALHRARFRGHDLIVMQVLDRDEAHFPFDGPLVLEDPETGQTLATSGEEARRRYGAALAAWRAGLAQSLSAMRADFVPLDTSAQFDRALEEFLMRRARCL